MAWKNIYLNVTMIFLIIFSTQDAHKEVFIVSKNLNLNSKKLWKLHHFIQFNKKMILDKIKMTMMILNLCDFRISFDKIF